MKIIVTALIGLALFGLIWLDIVSRPHHRHPDRCDPGSIEGQFTSCSQKR